MVSANDVATFDRLLRLGVRVPTDDLQLLLDRGFTREEPEVASGERAHHWCREIDRGYRNTANGFARDIVHERARLSFIAQSSTTAQRPANAAAAMRQRHADHTTLLRRFEAAQAQRQPQRHRVAVAVANAYEEGR